MNVIFLVEGGPKYGLGHLTRSAVLIDALKARGVAPVLAVRTGEGGLADWALPDVERIEIGEIDDTAAADRLDLLVHERQPDWVVVDAHGLMGAGVVERLRGKARVVAFDDMGIEGGGAEVVVNQNRFSDEGADASKGRLFGPQYALVDHAYAVHRDRPISQSVERVVVTFGGSDLHGLTAPTVEALGNLADARTIDVVIGPYHETQSFNAGSRNRLNIHRQPKGLAELFGIADLVISAAGSTCWQACCAGVPLIAVQTAENQNDVVTCLSAAKCALTFGRQAFTRLLTAGKLPDVFEKLSGPDMRRRMVAAQRHLVDGKGAVRIAEAMGV